MLWLWSSMSLKVASISSRSGSCVVIGFVPPPDQGSVPHQLGNPGPPASLILRLQVRSRSVAGGAPPAGQRVDGDGGQQHQRGHHVLVGRGQAEQSHAVVDGGDDQTAEEGTD